MKISTVVLISALSLQAAELKVSSRFFRWHDGDDAKPRIVPNLDLYFGDSSFTGNVGSQVLGYGHQLGDLHLGLTVHHGLDYSASFYRQLYDEFPSRGFRAGSTGFGPEGFIIGSHSFLSSYRLGIGNGLPHLSYFIGLEDGYNDLSTFTQAVLDLHLKDHGFSTGIAVQMFADNIIHEKHRVHLAGKVFDVHRIENPIYFDTGYEHPFYGTMLLIKGSWLLSRDVGTRFGQCDCNDGQTDGFSPDFAKFRLELSVKSEVDWP